MKPNRLLAIFLVVAAWLTSLCLFMEPSHACCQQGQHKLQQVLPSCCVSQAVVPAQPDLTGYDGPTPHQWVSASLFDYQALLNLEQPNVQRSRQDLAHVPDQSGRHLELRILLN